MAPRWTILTAACLALAAPGHAAAVDAHGIFAPRPDGRKDRLDFSAWSEVLAAYVVSMGPPLRKMPPGGFSGSRRNGHNSIYRLEGAMVGFSFIDRETTANIARYRRELEELADRVDIQALPRNEQLAYWFNLHNVAMVEKIAEVWPVYVPRDIMVDGAQLDEARFITVRGMALSPRDIRERIVFPHWRSPEVIYGFWRGEIGGPAIQRSAYEGKDIANQLARAAREFANSRRGVERRGGTLHVSRLYAEAGPFFFPDFEADLRAHLARHVEGKVAEMLAETAGVEASLREHDIADLSGGRLLNEFYRGRLSPADLSLLSQRAWKFEYIARKMPRSVTVTFSNIYLPDDPPERAEVE